MSRDEKYYEIRSIIGEASMRPVQARLKNVNDNKLDFAHYTSADTAFKIIQSKSLLLRNSQLMNDYSEMRRGLRAVQLGFGGSDPASGGFWHDAISIHTNIKDKFYKAFEHQALHLLENTYIACLSEFSTKRNLGKLSMWRAYGYPNGVALIIDRDIISSDKMTVDITTYPVIYTEPGTTVSNTLSLAIQEINKVVSHFKDYDEDYIVDILVNIALRYATCIKDSNFSEEVEWRAVYQPGVYDFEVTKYEPTVLGGTPQIVRKLDLGDASSIPLKKALKKIVIGPTEYPKIAQQTFVKLLYDEGFDYPELKVEIAEIPFRGD